MKENNFEIFTSSEISTFKNCPFSWYWKYYQGLHSYPSLNQLIGSAVHLGLSERILKRKGWEEKIDFLFRKEIPVETNIEGLRAKKELSKILVRKCPLDSLNITVTEETFLAPIRNPKTGWPIQKTRIGGKIDGLCEVAGQKDFWILEFKTTSSITPELIRRLEMDDQGLIYQNFFPVQTKGIVFFLIKKPLLRLKKNETETEFIERLDEAVIDSNYYFELFPRIENRLRENRSEVYRIVKFLKDIRRDQLWWHNSSKCGDWSGCAYFELCMAGNLDPPEELRIKFRQFETKHPELEVEPERFEETEVPF